MKQHQLYKKTVACWVFTLKSVFLSLKGVHFLCVHCIFRISLWCFAADYPLYRTLTVFLLSVFRFLITHKGLACLRYYASLRYFSFRASALFPALPWRFGLWNEIHHLFQWAYVRFYYRFYYSPIYIFAKGGQTKQLRERERDAVWVGKIESESKTESAAKKDGRINEQAKRRRQRQQHSNGHKNMCAVNEFLYFVAFGSILISHTHTHICTHMHVGAMGCCRRVCEREGHRLRTGEKKRNHVPRRLLPPLLLLLCPPSRMAYIFIYNFSFHFICAFFSPSSLWLIFGTALFWHFKNKHSFFRFSCPNFSPTVARAKLFRLLFCTVLDFTLYIFIYSIRCDAAEACVRFVFTFKRAEFPLGNLRIFR